jgi:hypothetical protein
MFWSGGAGSCPVRHGGVRFGVALLYGEGADLVERGEVMRGQVVTGRKGFGKVRLRFVVRVSRAKVWLFGAMYG